MTRMRRAPDKNLGWLLLGSTLLALGNGRFLLPAAAWLALVFLVRYIRGAPGKKGVLIALMAHTLAFWMAWRGAVPLPVPFQVVVITALSGIFFVPLLIDRALSSRVSGFAQTLVLPVAWVSVEYLNAHVNTPTGNGTPTVASVVVTPANAPLVSLEETVQLTATAQDASGNTLSGKTFTWSSSDQSVATVNSSGLVTAVANGSATIMATTDGVNGTGSVDVDQVVVQLTFAAQPTDAVAGAVIGLAVEVAIQDALGGAVGDATDAVTLAMGANLSGGTLSGMTTVNAVGGVATFSDLSIDKRGVGYTLVASSSTFATTSADFQITGRLVFVTEPVDTDGAWP